MFYFFAQSRLIQTLNKANWANFCYAHFFPAIAFARLRQVERLKRMKQLAGRPVINVAFAYGMLAG